MTKKLNSISLVAAVISFLAVILTVANLVLVLINNGFNNLIDSVDVLVSIPFAFFELSNGIGILKIRAKNETSKELKPIFSLLNSILYGVAAEFIVGTFKDFYFVFFNKDYELLPSLTNPLFYLPIIIAISLIIATSVITRFLKRDKYSLIAKSGIIFSILLIAFSIIFCDPFKGDLISISATVSNYFVVITVAIYCAFAISFYKKNHESIDIELLKDKDFEVVKEENGSTKIKVYAERGENSLVTYIFVFTSLILLGIGCLLMLINEIIVFANLKKITGNAFVYSTFDLLYLLISVIFLVKTISVSIKIIKKETKGMVSVASLFKVRTLGTFYIIFDFLSLIIAIFNRSIDIACLFSINNLAPLLVIVIPMLVSTIGSKTFSKCNDTVRNGGALSEEKTSYGISVVIFYACSLPVIIYSLLQIRNFNSLKFVSFLIISISFILFMIYGILYSKRPLKEVYKEKTKVDLSKIN